MSYGNRVPIESTCDSTTSDFTESTSSYVFSSSPVEHSEVSVNEKNDPVFQDLCDRNDTELDNAKGPDSTFNANIGSSPTDLPPAYMSQPFSPLSENNVQHYLPAGTRSPEVNMLQSALDSLATILHLPITILGPTTLDRLSVLLDPDISPSKNWKHMAEEMYFDNFEIRKFEEQHNKAKAVIDSWGRRLYRGRMPTVGDLIEILRYGIERIDVVSEIPKYFMGDARRSQNRMVNYANPPPARLRIAQPYACPSPGNSYAGFQQSLTYYQPSDYGTVREESWENMEKAAMDNSSSPVQVPTVESGMPEYDAFVLCNMADKVFVINDFLLNVEEKAGLKLCLADRDMDAGDLSYEQQLNYMFNRSRKLVVILSDEFFQSREHCWQSNLAISRDPASRNARIIVVKYKKLSVPNIFDSLGCCDLTKTMKDEWFWNKIIHGIRR